MPEMSDFYINICLRISGNNLEAKKTNSVIDDYNTQLENLKIEEVREDGKKFKCWVVGVDEFRHELLSKDVLICSRRVRFEVRSPYPHPDNHMNGIQAKIHKYLMDLRIHHEPNTRDEIIIQTTGTHIAGNTRTGRWPRDRFDGAGF